MKFIVKVNAYEASSSELSLVVVAVETQEHKQWKVNNGGSEVVVASMDQILDTSHKAWQTTKECSKSFYNEVRARNNTHNEFNMSSHKVSCEPNEYSSEDQQVNDEVIIDPEYWDQYESDKASNQSAKCCHEEVSKMVKGVVTHKKSDYDGREVGVVAKAWHVPAVCQGDDEGSISKGKTDNLISPISSFEAQE